MIIFGTRSITRIFIIAGLLFDSSLGIRVASRTNRQNNPGASAAVAQPKTPQTLTPRQALARAHFYYNNDDITDTAANQYRLVIKSFPGTEEAETAQYYLGSYYQRKYYIVKERLGRADEVPLDRSGSEYRAYISSFFNAGSHKWLADAHFNLALVYLQRGDSRAEDTVSALARISTLDASVYIYQVVWSRKYGTVVDYSVPAHQLAEFMLGIIKSSKPPRAPSPLDFGIMVAKITAWCQSRRGQPYAK